jgi:hypothetical protein
LVRNASVFVWFCQSDSGGGRLRDLFTGAIGMASNGYIIFTVTGKVRFRRGDDTIPLDDLDGNGANLLFETAHEAHRLAQQGVRTIDRFEQAYEVISWRGRGGTLRVDGALGAYGTAGNTVNIDTQARRAYTDRDANMADLRALLGVAEQAHEAVLVCERRGARHLKNLFEQELFRPIERRHGVTLTIHTHVDLDAWSGYLDGATANKVTATWRSQRDEDYRPESRKLPELKMTAEGGMALRVGRNVLDAARRKATRQTPESIRITELTPRDAENYADPRFEIDVTDAAGTARKVSIERAQLPQWIYPQGSRRLPPNRMYETFAEHAASILLSEVGATIPQTWSSAPWPAGVVRQVEARRDDEAPGA